MTILVTGATGNVGGALVGALHRDGVPVRALARDPSSVSCPDGVETIAGDLTRPADWAGALEGADGVFLMSGHDGMTELLTRARDAGIRRAVLLSASAVEAYDLDNAVSRYQAQAEADVRASGLEWTFLRPEQLHDQRAGVGRAASRRGRRARAVRRRARRDHRAASAAARCGSVHPSRWRRPIASASWARSWGATCATRPCPTPRPPRRCTRRCPPPTPRRS
jgi:uncharacterized protein YbjT (DUF2867 family)